jgi:hypothetical protein
MRLMYAATWTATLRARAWFVGLLGQLPDRLRDRGVLRAAPVSLAMVLLSLIATASMRIPSPLRHDARAVLVYRGHDLQVGILWRLPTSALLAQSWWQWAWTVLMAMFLFAALEVRIGGLRLAICLLASHCVPTVVLAILAVMTHHQHELQRPDFGTSCLVAGVIAALAWQARSATLAAIVLFGLVGDLFLNSPVTISEHIMAAALGVLTVVRADESVRRAVLDRLIKAPLPNPDESSEMPVCVDRS